MKYSMIKRASSLFVMMTAAIFALGMTTLTAAPQQGKATVVNVKGDAQYSTGGAWQPVKAGMTLTAGTVIQTADGAEVDLDMGPSGVLKVDASSTVSIDKLTVEQAGPDTITETQLDVRKGKIGGKVNKQSTASRYEIKTAAGVAGIRGTVFAILANGDVWCSEGSVVAAVFIDGKLTTITVPAGQKFNAATGKLEPLTDAEKNFLNFIAAIVRWIGGANATATGNFFMLPGSPQVFVDPLTSSQGPPVGNND